MQNTFYASGFLYRPTSQQILLQQLGKMSSENVPWTMVCGKSNKKEEAEGTFKRIIEKVLKVKLDPKSTYSVYDYFHSEYNAPHYVFYAEIKETKNVRLPKGNTFSWFTFKQIEKLPLADKTKQDIIVAKRVIEAKNRELNVAVVATN